MSRGQLQHDLWGVAAPSKRWDWDGLRASIKDHGVRNSLLLAPMPTASTSQILGNNECFEPYTSNIYVRRVLSGEFTVVNQHLLHDLTNQGMWNPALKNELVAANGSVQGLDIPMGLKALYKTVWEIKQRTIVDMAADRGAFIDQSQSLNIHIEVGGGARGEGRAGTGGAKHSRRTGAVWCAASLAKLPSCATLKP